MKPQFPRDFEQHYQTHLKRLTLQGLRPKTIEAYSLAVRRAGEYFDYRIDDLTEPQLTEYFSDLLQSHSWSTLKHDLYGLKFYYEHVLHQPWVAPQLVKSPRVQQLPDIVTVDQARQIFATTRVLSYRVLFFTLYSLGLRLGEGLGLQVGDIDAPRGRVHIRCAKGNRDRFVPLPDNTLLTLRRFWQVHRHPRLLFPNRKCGLKGAHQSPTPLDKSGVQVALRQAVADCGLKKRSPPTVCAIATPRI